MHTLKNYFELTGIFMHAPKKRNTCIRTPKKSQPLSSPATAPFPIYYPTQIIPFISIILPPLMEPPTPVYPKFN